MKTAVVVVGMCRNLELSKETWSILPFDADWYMSTWDITKATYSNRIYSSNYEIDKIRNKFVCIETHSYFDFEEYYLKAHQLSMYGNIFYLMSKVRDKILSQNYERIIVTRSDLYLHKVTELSEQDFYVDNSTANILGMHEPVTFVNHDLQVSEDQFICMNRTVFEKYSDLNYFKQLSKKTWNIHQYVYMFFDENKIKLEPIKNMRSVLVRPEAEQYAKLNPNFTYDDLVKIFMEVYLKRDDRWGGKGKFVFDYDKNVVDNNRILDRVNKSVQNKGILKSRKL